MAANLPLRMTQAEYTLLKRQLGCAASTALRSRGECFGNASAGTRLLEASFALRELATVYEELAKTPGAEIPFDDVRDVPNTEYMMRIPTQVEELPRTDG